MKKLSFFSLIFFPILNAQSLEIGGIVVDRESQTPLFGVNIVSGESGTTTDKLGQFELFVNFGDEVSFSFIGYKEVITIVKSNMIVSMEPIVLKGDQINVSANRAISGVTPVSFSNLSWFYVWSSVP